MIKQKLLLGIFLVFHLSAIKSLSKDLRVGVVQARIENTLDKNLVKILSFIDKAKHHNCDLVIFPESLLYHEASSTVNPSKATIDQAIEKVRTIADLKNIYVILCSQYKDTDSASFYNKAFVFDPAGTVLIDYKKYLSVPPRFYVNEIPMNLVLCADRWFL